jgi:DNA mismatch endonuclease (patch repair protein)
MENGDAKVTDVFTKEKRSQVMAKIRSQGSKIEIRMKNALDQSGVNYEYQPKLFGRPDFLVESKIAVFCDSSFWHGRNWANLKKKLSAGYWQDHIGKNRERDVLVNKALKKQGYIVLRFWDDEIRKNVEACVRTIKDASAELEAVKVNTGANKNAKTNPE